MKSVIRNLWRQVRPTANRFGFDIVPTNRYAFDRHIKRLGISLIFDIGANVGQFAQLVRSNGFGGRIISFEPVAEAFNKISEVAKSDPNWIAIHSALGSSIGSQEINVSNHTTMSSFLKIKSAISDSRDWALINRQETVAVTILDEVFSRYATELDTVLLKLDVQGFEDQVLIGAKESLTKIAAIQLEAALTPMYHDESLLCSNITFLEKYGFRLIDLADAWRDELGRLHQVDAFFERMT
jgi:FkbM family methyltransferase